MQQLEKQMKQQSTFTVKCILNNINKLNSNGNNNINFSKLQLQVLFKLGKEWYECNKISKLHVNQQHCLSLESKKVLYKDRRKSCTSSGYGKFFQ